MSYKDKVSQVCNINIEELNKLMTKAEEITKEEIGDSDKDKFYAYATSIFKNMLPDSCKEKLKAEEGLITSNEIISVLNEVQYKKVVRQGKVVRKAVCADGYIFRGGKCVRMSPKEIRNRSRSAKIGSRKVKGKYKQISRKRARSLKRRTF